MLLTAQKILSAIGGVFILAFVAWIWHLRSQNEDLKKEVERKGVENDLAEIDRSVDSSSLADLIKSANKRLREWRLRNRPK